MIISDIEKSAVIWGRRLGCVLALAAVSGCSGGGEARGGDDRHVFAERDADSGALSSSADTSGVVLMNVKVPALGQLTIIDEDPASEQPELGVLLLSSVNDTLVFPLAHPDGSAITAYEYLLAVGHAANVPERILAQHQQVRGNTATQPLIPKALQLSSGSCSSWSAYFNGQAGGLPVGAPTHVLNQTGTLTGNVGYFSNIIAGACFAFQSNPLNLLPVSMQRRTGSNPWSLIAGTGAALHTSGPNRYVYSSTSFFCSSFQRRIRVEGHAGDVFHASGAWGGLNGCNIVSGN